MRLQALRMISVSQKHHELSVTLLLARERLEAEETEKTHYGDHGREGARNDVEQTGRSPSLGQMIAVIHVGTQKH